MKYVEVVTAQGNAGTVAAIAESAQSEDFRLGFVSEDGLQQMRMLVSNDKVQAALDALQSVLSGQPGARVVVLAVEASLPRQNEDQGRDEHSATAVREALYDGLKKGARSGVNYFLLVFLSTIVAAIGLIENNVAVVIGAMVIAPLLGPNLALSLGTALGDLPLVRQSAVTLLLGICLAVTLSAGLGYFWPSELNSFELMSRTEAGLDSVALALASGAAAALSITTGLSSVLVGVMVAVALLPPAATVGLMLGQGSLHLALGAVLLLAINIVCVNLASKIVFYAKDIRPRTWIEKEKARSAMRTYVIVWLVTLVVLVLFVYARRSMP